MKGKGHICWCLQQDLVCNKYKVFGCDSAYTSGIVCCVWSKTRLTHRHSYLSHLPPVSFVELLLDSSFAWAKIYHFGAFSSQNAHSSDPAPVEEMQSSNTYCKYWLYIGPFINCKLSKTCHPPQMPQGCKHTVFPSISSHLKGRKHNGFWQFLQVLLLLYMERKYLSVIRMCDTEQIQRGCSLFCFRPPYIRSPAYPSQARAGGHPTFLPRSRAMQTSFSWPVNVFVIMVSAVSHSPKVWYLSDVIYCRSDDRIS